MARWLLPQLRHAQCLSELSSLTLMKKQFGQWSLSFGGVACIICWILLFSAGLFVGTKPFRDHLEKSFDLGDLFRVCLCYAPTNAALLTCLAGLAGVISSRLTYGPLWKIWPDPGKVHS